MKLARHPILHEQLEQNPRNTIKAETTKTPQTGKTYSTTHSSKRHSLKQRSNYITTAAKTEEYRKITPTNKHKNMEKRRYKFVSPKTNKPNRSKLHKQNELKK